MPFVRPVTMQLVVAEVQLNEPGDDVTVYSVMAEPPFVAGAVHETVAWPLPRTPETAVGADGGPTGVTLVEAVDATELPTAFVARTTNV